MFEPTYNGVPFSQCDDGALVIVAAGQWTRCVNDTGVEDALVLPVYRAIAGHLLMERMIGEPSGLR